MDRQLGNAMIHCCANCGVAGGLSLKTCKSCMHAKYCGAACQRNHWATHKKDCKLRAAELRDEALFKDPPAKEDCPICFLPMPKIMICCASLPPATRLSVPICDLVFANEGLADEEMAQYYSCCGKFICKGCIHSFQCSGNLEHCPFCKAVISKTDEEKVEGVMKRVKANDASAMCFLSNLYHGGLRGLQQDQERAVELLTRAAELGYGGAQYNLGVYYYEGGDLKKAKFHYEAAAMKGN